MHMISVVTDFSHELQVLVVMQIRQQQTVVVVLNPIIKKNLK